ncbi:MAG: DEAD/DEAH box helicase [Phycisphaerales bacterium]|nr:DEAD/DEAH box helicase [Phycisphaerales bacterium]
MLPEKASSKLVIHACWTNSRLHLWGESLALAHALRTGSTSNGVAHPHPFAMSAASLRNALVDAGVVTSTDLVGEGACSIMMPHLVGSSTPLPSARMSALLGVSISSDEALQTEPVEIPLLTLSPQGALRALLRLRFSADTLDERIECGHDLHWWCALARMTSELLVDQRVVPSITQGRGGGYEASWQAWAHEGAANQRLSDLLGSAPAIARAALDCQGRSAWPIVDGFLSTTIDAVVRDALTQEDYLESLADRDAGADPHVAWLSGLLGPSRTVKQPDRVEVNLLRGARDWLSGLIEIGDSKPLRLRLELQEPAPIESGSDDLWLVSFLLSSHDSLTVVDANQVWSQASGRRGARSSARGEELSELLVHELGRAARVWPRLEDALEEGSPASIELSTKEAYALLSEYAPILLESGVDVVLPDWWGSASSRLGARLIVDPVASAGGGSATDSSLGLQALVTCRWQISLGDQPFTLKEFEALSQTAVPLVRVGGKWAEIRPEDLEGAVRFLREQPGGTMTLLEALRLANRITGPVGGLNIIGMTSSGWVADAFGESGGAEALKPVEQPQGFQGSLRPYQQVGLSWLAFLSRHRLGACLADDMGLGKTIQLIALLLHERETAEAGVEIGTTLLVAPMSVLGNWECELKRFSPTLTVHRQHGLDRPTGEAFEKAARSHDVVLTTYALIVRDKESFGRMRWARVVLDEAQHIKNPPTKQTASIRALESDHRIALTGTPVENRLSELWSILEFCCPGYLGTQADFRRSFVVPIERHRDSSSTDRLRSIVRPVVLRRLKTDPKVITDLPPLIEGRQHVPLTSEQARLYDSVVADMLTKVDATDGIRRRGLVLSALVKLKQICNHPAHFLREGAVDLPDAEATRSDGAQEREDAAEPSRAVAEAVASGGRLSHRSGKTERLLEMVGELLAAGDRALIFTQYRQMGHLLCAMLRHEHDLEPLFLHGGTPQAKRDAMVARFQSDDPAVPIFVLSLKAGGVGLNLTSANHVFHFDRWWNPAVENQATDRAFRIGQTRTVNVHKFICSGTLEERIDQMIEAKTELATQIIGSGDAWLTELSTTQLRDVLTLRRSALEEGT